ncbi:hypothetical protein FBUS_02007 [Fasciolopsis buskii]|uniref:Uncharacterized protein n=1 Tax=Fasciolopsis buskii TaxID=27845 RepID=A0A8E0VGH3_9TREM|nr:hypothetical protein FBUS_02007 [Fasciolopsis buski]
MADLDEFQHFGHHRKRTSGNMVITFIIADDVDDVDDDDDDDDDVLHTMLLNPPNFLIQSELDEHQALRVTVHDAEIATSGDESSLVPWDDMSSMTRTAITQTKSVPTTPSVSTELVPVDSQLRTTTSTNGDSVSFSSHS